MEINSTLDLIIFSFFTLVMLIAGIPMGLVNTIGGFKLLKKYGFKEIPENLRGRAFGKKPIEVLLGGLFCLLVSVWYLFIDRGGNFFLFLNELLKLTE